MKFIYGPVQSRRLGLSLGLSLTPHKICNFDCLYCQLGKTYDKVVTRKEYVSVEEIINELKLWLQNNSEEAKRLNFITISGIGEPTLNIKIAEVIGEIKKLTSIKVALITNASLLPGPFLRQEIKAVDLILPSLDAADEETFKAIDRPGMGINLKDIIEGLISLRKEFRGLIWLEVMLAKGINDSLKHIRKLKEVIERVNPDKIQLNSPVRTTSEAGILAVEEKRLKKIKEMLGEKCEVL